MKKKLVGRDEIINEVCENKFYLKRDIILSPSAKDYLIEKKIEIIYPGLIEKSLSSEECVKKISNKTKVEIPSLEEDVIKNKIILIKKILKEEFNIKDENKILLVVKKIIGGI
ncbi:MAG: hypothetical protein ACRC0S_03420 [Fusobacteriaceae bacterium]